MIRIGMSGWSYPDWLGNFYPRGTKSGQFLEVYARSFDVAEVPGTYYAIPGEKMVAGWRAHTPDGFTFLPKMPRSIVHAGERAQPDGTRVLHLDHVRPEVDLFLERVRALGPKLGPILVQLPYFNKGAFRDAPEFMGRLIPFLDYLPRELRFAVEIRNKGFLRPDLHRELTARGMAYGFADQEWMPPGPEVICSAPEHTREFSYVRLIGERERIEKILEGRPEGKMWTGVVLDRKPQLVEWAGAIALIQGWNVQTTFVISNNHFEGHGPTTSRTLARLLREKGLDPTAV